MASFACLHICTYIILCTVLVQSAIINLHEHTAYGCGKTFDLDIGETYIVKTTGNVAGSNCSLTFRGQLVGDCTAMCYKIQQGTRLTDPKVSVRITAGSTSNKLKNGDSLDSSGPQCFPVSEVNVLITEEHGNYSEPPNYEFDAKFYTKCGEDNSISFDEAVKSLEGFHHGDEFHKKVKGNYVSGILLGFGLSSIFLVLLLITYCYYKHSPNRGASRSVGMPSVGFKKKIKAKKTPDRAPEPTGRYTARDPETVELGKVQESKPLLKPAADDPDYVKPPPVGVDNGPTEVITEPADKPKISTSSESLKGDNCTKCGGDKDDCGECNDVKDSGAIEVVEG